MPTVIIDIKSDKGEWMRYHFSVADALELVVKVQKARETAWRNAWKPTPSERKKSDHVADNLIKAGRNKRLWKNIKEPEKR